MVPADHRDVHQGAGALGEAFQVRSDLHHNLKQRLGPAVSGNRLLGNEEGRSNIGAAGLCHIFLHRDHLRYGCLRATAGRSPNYTYIIRG